MTDSDRDPAEDPDDDLEEVAEELATELRALREELKDRPPRRPPRGLGGIPRPPSPRDVLRFADEFAIPAVIAILEANIKLLEALQATLRAADRGRRATERGRQASERGREVGERAASGAADLGETTLNRLSDSLADLQSALEGGAVPEDAAGSDLLADIQELRERIDQRVREGDERSRRTPGSDTPGDDGATTIDIDGGDDESAGRSEAGEGHGRPLDEDPDELDDEFEDPEDDVPVDVDAELDSLRDQYGKDEEESEDDGDDEEGGDEGQDGR